MNDVVTELRHELRTHVNHVLGYAELLSEGIDGPDQEFLYSPLQAVMAAGADALTSLNQLLSAEVQGDDAMAAKGALDRAFQDVIRQVGILNEEASQAGLEAVVVDLLRIDFAARHAAVVAGHPLLATHLLGTPAATGDEPGPARRSGDGAGVAAPRARGTILVVDDDPANRDVLSRRLERLGHSVLTATTGTEALTILLSTPVDLVLLDLMMPEMNGYELLERRKADGRLRDIPVIMISAHDDVDSVVECIIMGADDYLPKPFNAVLLEARVDASLEKKWLRDQEKDLLSTVQRQARELAELNETLEARVHQQVDEIGRLVGLRRFLSPQVADVIVSSSNDTMLQTHRREIAVLFCDLRGFTSFAETAEPEEVMSVLEEFHHTVGDLIHEFEATVGFFAGDGLMVFFNDPLPCPDPAERAVRLGVAMCERIGELLPTWRARGYQLGFAVGIAYGYATLGQMGFEGRFDYGVIGSVVNLAARLCDQATSSQILISGRARLAVEERWEVADVGVLSLKGFHSPVPAFQVVGPRRPAP
ncbi:MAG: adenylate/guanylate cyclase domain-containing protein [Acidimicrobiales bacterium]